MCRHLAYVGEPVTLQELLLDPPHSLVEQAYRPRAQRHGTMNVDGFGVGWYVEGRPEPVRYRRAQPIWSDRSFTSLAPTVTSGCLLAAVRDATPVYASDESCVAPFTHDDLLVSHNGAVADWPRLRKALADRVWDVPEATAPVDSALLFGLVVGHVHAGLSLGSAVAAVVGQVAEHGGGRVTLLATDGVSVAGTTHGERLFWRHDARHAVVASEPYDDDSGWSEVPADSLVVARRDGVRTSALELGGGRVRR